MAITLSIDPNPNYDERAISLALDISLSALKRTRREGRCVSPERVAASSIAVSGCSTGSRLIGTTGR
jgi:hypothetical protein